MTDAEKIQGSALLQLFTELQMNDIPLKMVLPNDDDVQLTYISDIRKRKRALHFRVNSPEGYRKLDQKPNQSRLKFEFSDRENIKYAFETNTWDLSHEMIWIRLPEFVQRYQRRKLFRLEAPHGTQLYFKVKDIRYRLLVINISLGGTLGAMVSLTKQMEQELKPYTSKKLENAELLFPSEDHQKADAIVKIKSCHIIRLERNPATGKFQCAIEFKEISEAEQKKLTDLFYKWQRDYLRKRKIMRA
jgi:c-di-GMP-binding flagellar brake protein YcgR